MVYKLLVLCYHALAINKVKFLAVKLEGGIPLNTLLQEAKLTFTNKVPSLLLVHNH